MSFNFLAYRTTENNSAFGRNFKERNDMTTYDNTNSGILTKNDKGDNPSRPDYRGSINVNGADFWLSAWIKDGREGTKLEGQKYLSISVKPKEESVSAPAVAPKAPVVDDSDIPF